MRRYVSKVLAAVVFAALVVPPPPVGARTAPESFADLSARLLPSVVNISTTQTIKRQQGPSAQRPQLPPGSQFEDFFREFFDRQQRRGSPQRRAQSRRKGQLGNLNPLTRLCGWVFETINSSFQFVKMVFEQV